MRGLILRMSFRKPPCSRTFPIPPISDNFNLCFFGSRAPTILMSYIRRQWGAKCMNLLSAYMGLTVTLGYHGKPSQSSDNRHDGMTRFIPGHGRVTDTSM